MTYAFDNDKSKVEVYSKDEVDTQISDVNDRVTNIITSPAPTEQEIIDARQGADGTNYPSLGDAIRDQVSDLKADIGNLLNEFNIEYAQIPVEDITKQSNVRWKAGGTETIEATGDTWYYVAYEIDVEHGGLFDFCGRSIGENGNCSIYVFDSSENLLVAISTATQTIVDGEQYHTIVDLPYDTKTIRYSAYVNRSQGLIYDSQKQGSIGGLKEVDGWRSEIDALESNFSVVKSKNLFNPSTVTTGFLLSDGGISTEGSYANYVTSDFIEIESSKDYTFSLWSSDYQTLGIASRRVGLLYDADKVLINNTYQNVNNVQYITFNNANAKYIRVCAPVNNPLMLEQASLPTKFVSYSVKKYSQTYVDESKMPYNNVLYGKKWAVCGDSFTNGATDTNMPTGTKYEGKNFVYPYIIGNRQNMDIVPFFLGGRTLAYPSDESFHNSLTDPNADCYYQNIPADVDYITFYIGINDEHHATGGGDDEESTGYIPLGTIDDNTTASYYGAWNVVLTWLITNRPFAHIGIIVTNGLSIESYREAQINIAEKYGIPYIDMNGDKQTPVMIRSVNPDVASAVKTVVNAKQRVSESNTHPNDATHEFESTFIENFLRSI